MWPCLGVAGERGWAALSTSSSKTSSWLSDSTWVPNTPEASLRTESAARVICTLRAAPCRSAAVRLNSGYTPVKPKPPIIVRIVTEAMAAHCFIQLTVSYHWESASVLSSWQERTDPQKLSPPVGLCHSAFGLCAWWRQPTPAPRVSPLADTKVKAECSSAPQFYFPQSSPWPGLPLHPPPHVDVSWESKRRRDRRTCTCSSSRWSVQARCGLAEVSSGQVSTLWALKMSEKVSSSFLPTFPLPPACHGDSGPFPSPNPERL